MPLTTNNLTVTHETGPFYMPVTPLPEDMPLFMQAGSGSDGSGSGDGGSNDGGGGDDGGGDDGGDDDGGGDGGGGDNGEITNPPLPDNLCPQHTGKTNIWTCLMNPNLWKLPRRGKAAFNWDIELPKLPNGEVDPDASPCDAVWTVLPTACSNAGEAGDTITWNTVINPPDNINITDPQTGENPPERNLNTIMTDPCVFSDFNLKFDYRCPNMRVVWKECGINIKGPRNWGNSGVKIFYLGSTPGAEVVISDFVWNDNEEFFSDQPIGEAIPEAVQANCTTGDGTLVYGQICGAIYNKISPQKKPIINPGVGRPNSPDVNQQCWPDGAWNRMEIGFMSPRYALINEQLELRRKATITVKVSRLNTDGSVASEVSTLTRVGIPNFEYDDQIVEYIPDIYAHGANESVYSEEVRTNPNTGQIEDWVRLRGPIYLQEHDSLIQFRRVRINLDWLPRQGATGTDVNPDDFDEGWQALP